MTNISICSTDEAMCLGSISGTLPTKDRVISFYLINYNFFILCFKFLITIFQINWRDTECGALIKKTTVLRQRQKKKRRTRLPNSTIEEQVAMITIEQCTIIGFTPHTCFFHLNTHIPQVQNLAFIQMYWYVSFSANNHRIVPITSVNNSFIMTSRVCLHQLTERRRVLEWHAGFPEGHTQL